MRLFSFWYIYFLHITFGSSTLVWFPQPLRACAWGSHAHEFRWGFLFLLPCERKVNSQVWPGVRVWQKWFRIWMNAWMNMVKNLCAYYIHINIPGESLNDLDNWLTGPYVSPKPQWQIFETLSNIKGFWCLTKFLRILISLLGSVDTLLHFNLSSECAVGNYLSLRSYISVVVWWIMIKAL